ncbi:MAG TPA: N-acetylmuramoyl-L-alanine amidase [Candidatus Limnocylindrales bacterium]|nr:N-acetylmuramoyl-L-alanine amidase [Candidatus Limnocylindrales bacterium]
MSSIYWVGSPKFTAGHPAPLIALVHHRMVGTLRSTDAAFTSTDGRAASTHFGVGSGCGRAGHPTSAHVHQYVRLGDQAWGNGNWDPSGAWDDRYPTTLVNSRTVSIEHHDNGGRTAGSGKGVVPEAVIAASIALDALLLRGDLAELKGAGIRFRAGTETAITRELRAIPIDRHHLIDHHYIAGRLKPSCWRPCADDPVGFPQARYLAALAPAPPAPEETVNSYPVPKVPSVATVPAGTWLYATSALEPSPDNICVDPGRDSALSGSAGEHGSHRRVRRCEGRPSGSLDVRQSLGGHHHPPGARPHAVQPGAARCCREARGRGGQDARRPRSRRVRSVTRDG